MGSFVEILCAVLIPPVGVFLRFGCGVCVLINIMTQHLTLMVLSKIHSNLFFPWFFCIFFLQLEFWLCLLLTFLGYIPGMIYAIWALTK